MSIPKEPRQMMINMMYLVLTALLALNVSAEILNAFKIVNDGIEGTIVALESKNSGIYDALEAKAEIEPDAVPLLQKATAARTITSNLISEMDSVIVKLKRKSGVKKDDEGNLVLKNDRDTHTPTLFMINDGHGVELQEKINVARKEIIELYDTDDRTSAEKRIPLKANDSDIKKTSSGIQKSWVEYNFQEVPAIAAVTILTKLKNDVKSSEADVMEYLSSKVGADKFKVDVLRARAIAKKSYLNLGDKYEADIFISASSSSTDPIVYFGDFDPQYIKKDDSGDWPAEVKTPGNGTTVPLNAGYTKGEDPVGGIVKYTASSGVGTRTYRGVIAVENTSTEETLYYPFENEYTVAASQAVVSADKMNVLYIGVDNPVSVSVPGYQANQVRPSISQGTITPSGNGVYSVIVNSPGNADVNVTVTSQGASKSLKGKKFRVKRIPNPTAYVGNSSGPVIKAGVLKASTGIYAKADNFDFDVNFTIKGFEVTYKKARSSNLQIKQNKGPLFGKEVKAIMNQVKPGDRLWIDNIRIASPDGTTRTANISYRIM